ncbi:MAG: cupin domain-containing protein [Sandaracinaceae bacterium]
MSGWESDILDGFLREASEESGLPELLDALEAEAGMGALRGPASAESASAESASAESASAESASAESLPASMRASLMDALALEGRFDRFVEGVASLLHIDDAGAKGLLDGIGESTNWVPSPLPQVTLYHIDGGHEVADAVTGFVRMEAGETFPEHKHCGHESVLVLQGSLLDQMSGEVFHPGQVATQDAGTSHSFIVRDGPDLVYLVVAQQGVMLGDQHITPDSPDF